jgi:septum formation protein
MSSFQAAEPKLVLASGSATRRALLTAAGLRHQAISPNVDEPALKATMRDGGFTAEQAAIALAAAKAAAVAQPGALIIGCDQLLTIGPQWLDKPATRATARHHLEMLRGRTHALVTAIVCVRNGLRVWQHVETPRLTMRAFSPGFLDAYLHAEGDHVLHSVGAYRLEGLGIHLFDEISGDHATILGLPLRALLGFLRRSGILLA